MNSEDRKWIHCPYCPDQGWYPVEKPNQNTGDSELQQEQCEWCYTTPDSFFNKERGENFLNDSPESELTQLRSQVSGLRMFHKWATTEMELQAKTILRLARRHIRNRTSKIT